MQVVVQQFNLPWTADSKLKTWLLHHTLQWSPKEHWEPGTLRKKKNRTQQTQLVRENYVVAEISTLVPRQLVVGVVH